MASSSAVDSLIPPAVLSTHTRSKSWLFDLLLVLILIAGVYFRFTGVKWDDSTHLHPDERFLTMVETSIAPVNSISAYFNTLSSSLNPANRGYTFFVYGTLPIFIVRYVGEAIHQTGYDQIDLVGRQLSALADLLTVFLVFLIGQRLYNRRVGLVAAAFSAFSVLPIQLSHFFTVDTFTNFFGFLAIYFAVRVMTGSSLKQAKPDDAKAENGSLAISQRGWLLAMQWAPYALFGVALGMATASKINAALLAIVLPLAEVIRIAKLPGEDRKQQVLPAASNMVVAAVISVLIFRICQPYAFSGPGFFSGISPNFIATMTELASQSTGNIDFPPAL